MIVPMDQVVIYVALAVFGAGFGSFAGAQVWRLRARQLEEDIRAGESIDKKEYKRLAPLAKTQLASDRSRCLSCGHTLAWYDLLPLVSWLSTGGVCRYCKKPIGRFELLIEAGMAGAFMLSYLFWPVPLGGGMDTAIFIVWLLALVAMAIIFAYDTKWFLIPGEPMVALIVIGIVSSILQGVAAPDTQAFLFSLLGAALIFSGLYFVLYKVSHERWVGFGDVELGFGLALLLADWRLALVALFAANLIGTLVVLPAMVTGKISRKAHVPFGPLMIAGTLIAVLVGSEAVSIYLGVSF